LKKLHINNPLTVFAGTVLFPAADRRSQEGILELCHIFRTSISNSYTAKPQNQLRKESQGDIKSVFVFLFLNSLANFCYVLSILPALYLHYVILYTYFLLSLHILFIFHYPCTQSGKVRAEFYSVCYRVFVLRKLPVITIRNKIVRPAYTQSNTLFHTK